MSTGNHKDRSHAILSASGAYRWMKCPPSALLEEAARLEFGDESSEFAEQGTFAHELGELEIKHALSMVGPKQYEEKKAELMKSEFFDDEMEEEVDKYVAEVLARVDEARKTDKWVEIAVEDRFDLRAYVPDGFGANDAAIISTPRLRIADLKFGKGIRVSAEGSPQTRLYALGALEKYGAFHDIKEVEMTIIQPRLNNTSSEVLTVEELRAWGESEVKPRAALAMAGKGEFSPGDHCRFCKVAPRCRALASKNLEVVKYEFKNPDLLTDEELTDVFDKSDMLVSWAATVQKFLLKQAVSGKSFKGYKLVEGRSNRRIEDEDAAIKQLKANGYKLNDIVNRKIKGIGDLTKLVGKDNFEAVLGPFVVKPQGAPTLVPESDSRPPFNSVENLKNQFN